MQLKKLPSIIVIMKGSSKLPMSQTNTVKLTPAPRRGRDYVVENGIRYEHQSLAEICSCVYLGVRPFSHLPHAIFTVLRVLQAT